MPKKDGTPTKWERREELLLRMVVEATAEQERQCGEGPYRMSQLHTLNRIADEFVQKYRTIFVAEGLPKPPT